jgi:hypothetical protein
MNVGSAGRGNGAKGSQTKAGDANTSGKDGKPGGGGRGDKGGGSKGQKGKSGNDKNGKSSGSSDTKDSNGGGEEKDGEKSDEKKDEESEREGKTDAEEDESKDKAEGKDGNNRETKSSNPLSNVAQAISKILKWIVFAIVAVLILVGLVLGILRYLAPFTEWARKLLDSIRAWWAGLFRARVREAKAAAASAAPTGPSRPPPFHEFTNPFEDGSAERRFLKELASYTFLALDSWAWDRECGRDPKETPLEFCVRLGESFPDIAENLDRFAKTYARVAYSELPPSKNTLAILEETWEAMIHGVAVG